jgi:hypothetical protein
MRCPAQLKACKWYEYRVHAVQLPQVDTSTFYARLHTRFTTRRVGI